MTEQVQTERSWLKLQDGESQQFRILDDVPSIHVLHWVSGAAQDHEEQDCPWCKAGIRAATRYTVPIESPDGSDCWEMASLTWKDLKAVGKVTGGIKGQTIALSRRGTGRATRYTIVPLGHRGPVSSDAPAATPQTATSAELEAEQIETIALKEEMARIVADPAGAADYVKVMCSHLKISTEVALASFHSANPDVGQDAGSVRILAGLYMMLEQKCNEAKAEPVPELDVALGELLGFDTTGKLGKGE